METKEEQIQTQAGQLVTQARADAWQVPTKDGDSGDGNVDNIFKRDNPKVELWLVSIWPKSSP